MSQAEMAEEQLQCQELDVVDSTPLLPGFGGDDGEVKMETSSDIIIYEERCPSRSSSPDIEVLEVLKSKTHITVDLTLDDDSQDEEDISNATHKRLLPKQGPSTKDCRAHDIRDIGTSTSFWNNWSFGKVLRPHHGGTTTPLPSSTSEILPLKGTRSEPKIAPYRRRRRHSEEAEILEISCDDSTDPMPEEEVLEHEFIRNSTNGRYQVPSVETTGDFLGHSQALGDLANHKRLGLENYIKEEVMEDTLSMMMELESIIPQHCSPPPYTFTERGNCFSKNSMQCGRTPTLGSSSTGDLMSSYLGPPAAYSGANGKLSESGPSHSGNFCDMPLDMSLSSVPLSKEDNSLRATHLNSGYQESTSQCKNPYSLLSGNSYDTGQASTSSIQFEDAISFALREAELCSDTPITSHPNSAFDTVTPSTSSSHLQPAMTSSADISGWHGTQSSSSSSFGDRSLGNASLNMWNPVAPNVTSTTSTVPSQRFDPLSSLFETSGVSVGISLSVENSTEVTSSLMYPHQYTAVPSTSSNNNNYSQGGSNPNFLGFVEQPGPTQSVVTHTSTVLPILSPNTIREHTSEVIPSLQNTVTTTAMLDKPAEEHRNLENNKSLSTAAESTPPGSPSTKEPTFSCIICLDSLKTIRDSSRNLCSTVCGHVFCSACLQSALKRKKECPMCRKKLGKKQYHPLFL